MMKARTKENTLTAAIEAGTLKRGKPFAGRGSRRNRSVLSRIRRPIAIIGHSAAIYGFFLLAWWPRDEVGEWLVSALLSFTALLIIVQDLIPEILGIKGE